MKFRISNFRFRRLWLPAACLLAAQIALAQAPNPPSKPPANPPAKLKGSITGQIAGEDGQPVGGAQVLAAPFTGKRQSIQVIHSDAEGRFTLTGLSEPAYQLYVQVPGFILDKTAVETPRRLGEHVTLNLIKGGVITGRVADPSGEPMVAVRVFARRLRGLAGEAADPNAMLRMDGQDKARLTDDRGVYRIFGLEPGAYVVYVNANAGYFPSQTEMGNEAPIYHPSSPREAAAEILVQSGAEIQGVDIRHRVERGHSISGTTTGAAEGVRGGLIVLLRNAATGQLESFTQSGNPAFAFFALPDGEYELTAIQTSFNEPGKEQGLSASAPRRVTVRGASLAGVELKLAKLGSIAGRVVIERLPAATCQPPAPVRVESVLLAAREDRPETPQMRLGFALAAFGETLGEAAPDAGGEFRLPNLQAGRYRIEANLPSELLYLRSITQPAATAGKKADAARSPFTLKQSEKLTSIEITVAEGAAALDGRVTASEGQRLPKRMLVHLIPAEPAAADDVLRYREAVANEDGSFAFQHLAPGKYWLLARTGIEMEAKKTALSPAAFDASERAKLRREAEAVKNEITLQACQRAKDVTVKAGLEK